MKHGIIINDGYDVGVIPSSLIIRAMLRRKEQVESPAITVGRVPEPTQTTGIRGRGGQILGTLLLAGTALYIVIHLVIWAVK